MAKKIDALDAAAKVVGEAGLPMTAKEMIDQMAAKATGNHRAARLCLGREDRRLGYTPFPTGHVPH
jgi:hypothetical protein